MSTPTTDELYREETKDISEQLRITKQLVMLHAASRNISATLDNQQVEYLITQEFSYLLSGSTCFLGNWNDECERLEIVANYQPHIDKNNSQINVSILNLHPLLVNKVLTRRNVLHVSNNTQGIETEILRALEDFGVVSLLVLPLFAKNQLLGLVEVQKNSGKPFETHEIVLARLLANQAAISIENARLFQSAKQEILARQKTEEKLKYNALHDVLTGLPNRILFLDRLKQTIARYKRVKNLEYAVLFIDLDRFKGINDSFGHIEGDRALKEIAERLKNSIREGDTVCRFGGDEFLVLLEGELNQKLIEEITTRIQKNLTDPILIENFQFNITASIGIAFGMPDTSNPYEYIRNANLAMYNAKSKGGGKAEFFSTKQGLTIKNKFIIESTIREAARKKDFHLNYQPVYNLETLSIVGFEVLLRWKRENALIPPSKFIPMLESFGLMPELGLWILETAIRNYQSWIEYHQAVSQITMSVNISNLQLAEEEFVEQLTQILKETKMDPNKLILEITEHVLIDDLEQAEKKIQALNEMGIKVHLDDFGTGYSSLSYLNELPVQALKIDRKFVQQINPADMDQGLVSSILSMARKFNVMVIAEGIETEKHLQGLRYAECNYGQGNFLSPAVSDTKLLKLIKASPFVG